MPQNIIKLKSDGLNKEMTTMTSAIQEIVRQRDDEISQGEKVMKMDFPCYQKHFQEKVSLEEPGNIEQ